MNSIKQYNNSTIKYISTPHTYNNYKPKHNKSNKPYKNSTPNYPLYKSIKKTPTNSNKIKTYYKKNLT